MIEERLVEQFKKEMETKLQAKVEEVETLKKVSYSLYCTCT